MTDRKWIIPCVLFLVAMILSGCSLFGGENTYTRIDENGNVIGEENPFADMTAKKLLLKGMDDYSVGKYSTASKAFNEILDRYPFSQEAVLAELKAADCSYYMDNFQEAFTLYENFENSHPTNESMPYVMFQKAMCYYHQIDRVDRDPTGAEKAVTFFKQLIKAYPDSAYTPDAREKLKIAREFLANHEFFVAKFYIRTDKYDQARARLRYMLATYSDCSITEDGKKLLASLKDKKESTKKHSIFGFLSGDSSGSSPTSIDSGVSDQPE